MPPPAPVIRATGFIGGALYLPPHRILPIEARQGAIQPRVSLLQGRRALEEDLGRLGEELSLVGGAVGVDQGVAAAAGGESEAAVALADDALPSPVAGSAGDGRDAVHVAVAVRRREPDPVAVHVLDAQVLLEPGDTLVDDEALESLWGG